MMRSADVKLPNGRYCRYPIMSLDPRSGADAAKCFPDRSGVTIYHPIAPSGFCRITIGQCNTHCALVRLGSTSNVNVFYYSKY
jgi:hypothetical protein